MLVKTYSFDTKSNIILGDALLAVQLSNSDSIGQANQLALDNKIAQVNAEKCIEDLKQSYNINSVIILKTDYDSDIVNLDNLDKHLISNSVNFKVFDPVTREELNTTICNGKSTINIKTLIKEPELLNLTFYTKMANSSIDIYDPNNAAFNDICSTHIDTNTNFDTTVNWRRTNYYQNLSAICEGANCTYAGIDSANYTSCNCTSLAAAQNVFSEFKEYLLGQFSVWNFGVVFCPRRIINVKLN
jgi:hypothetical protein